MKAIERNRPAATPVGGRGSLWWWIVIAIALQLAAWTVWIIVATRHPIEEVPVVTGAHQRAE